MTDFTTEGTPPFINRRLSIPEWEAYVASYDFGRLAPSKIVLHHTYKPTVAGWAGLATMRAMQRFYAEKGWTAAPHIYTAPDGIWLATPMSQIGIHAGEGNGSLKQGWYSIGLEMVGDYDKVQPSGPVWQNTLAVLTGLTRRLKRLPGQLLDFHRDYSTKTCPGSAVTKSWVLGEWAKALVVGDWRNVWTAKGVALPPEHWAVPTLYATDNNWAKLGACLAPEQWRVEGVRSVTEFERGTIIYVKAKNEARIVLD